MEIELRCKKCDRYLGKAFGTVVMEIRCTSSCKEINQIKHISGDLIADMKHKFAKPTVPQKKAVEVS